MNASATDPTLEPRQRRSRRRLYPARYADIPLTVIVAANGVRDSRFFITPARPPIDASGLARYFGFTTTASGHRTRQTRGIFMPGFRPEHAEHWRDDRPEYKTRKGNKVSRLAAVVESRRPSSGGYY